MEQHHRRSSARTGPTSPDLRTISSNITPERQTTRDKPPSSRTGITPPEWRTPHQPASLHPISEPSLPTSSPNVKPPGINPHPARPASIPMSELPEDRRETTAGKNSPEQQNDSPANRILSRRIPDGNQPPGGRSSRSESGASDPLLIPGRPLDSNERTNVAKTCSFPLTTRGGVSQAGPHLEKRYTFSAWPSHEIRKKPAPKTLDPTLPNLCLRNTPCQGRRQGVPLRRREIVPLVR